MEARVRQIRRQGRRRDDAEEKLRNVLGDAQGEDTITEPCRREGIGPNR